MLEQDIRDIRENLRRARYANEAAVSQSIVRRLLGTLGWPIYDPQVVYPEYTVEGGRVDYALCHPASKPRVFIEVKQVGQSDGAEQQLFEYASHMFHMGVQLAVLTDGREWSFFLPARVGSYDERRICRLDLVERDVAGSVQRLQRYLRYEAVVSEEALIAAQEDYRDIVRERDIQEALPKAWVKVVAEEDTTLLDVVAECVGDLCGYKPAPDAVARFLRTLQPSSGPLPTPAGHPVTSPPPLAPQDKKPPSKSTAKPRRKSTPSSTRTTGPEKGTEGTPAGVGFTLFGEFVSCQSGRDVLIKVVEALEERDPSFTSRFVARPKHGSKRRYIAQNRNELLPGHPKKETHRLPSGYWLGLKHAYVQINSVIKLACEVAGIGYGTDLKITLK